MLRRSLLPLVALAVFVAGCGGDASSATSAPPSVSVREYLARILELELAASPATPEGRTTASELAGYNYDIAARYESALTAIDAMTPPPEAAAHATAYRAYADLGAQTFRAAAEALLEGGADESLQAQLSEITASAERLGTLFNGLLVAGLEAGGDPLSVYLVAGVSLRNAFSDAYTEAVGGLSPLIASGDGPAIAQALEASADQFDDHLSDWRSLDPPEAAADTHALQEGLIVEVAQIFRDLVEPVADEDEQATAAVAGRMDVFITNVGDVNNAWNRLLVQALRS